jgi:Domain of Unknown Function (DUF1080)
MKITIALSWVLVLLSLSGKSQSKKWVNLFDGKSFSNWHVYNHAGEAIPSKWKIENKTLIFDKNGKSNWKVNDLVSDKTYENFILELEWSISEKGNSGIFYGVFEDPKLSTPYLSSPEIQVLDDLSHPDAKAGKNGNRKSGSLYDMIPSATKAKPAGEWNKIKIEKRNNRVSVWQNNVLAVSYPTEGPEWEALVADSKFKTWESFGKYTKGKIGLQDHGDGVSFRKIKIKEL